MTHLRSGYAEMALQFMKESCEDRYVRYVPVGDGFGHKQPQRVTNMHTRSAGLPERTYGCTLSL
jgi:hypothetical protein